MTTTPSTPNRLQCGQCPTPKPASWCAGCPREETSHFVDARLTGPSDVVVITEAPVIPRIHNLVTIHTPYADEAGTLLNKVIANLRSEEKAFAALKVDKTYAVLCTGEDPNKATLDRCQGFLHTGLQLAQKPARPPVLIAMGMTAVKALGIKAKSLKEVQSRVFTGVLVNNVPHTVICTISSKMLVAMAGLYTTFVNDVRRAFSYAATGETPTVTPVAELTKDYRFPKTLDEVRELCAEITRYAEDGVDPVKWSIATDTETNTLFPHRDSLKLLCVSFAWATGKAAAIPLWHKDCPYDPAQAIVYVNELLASPKPKILHNGKYDVKVFRKKLLTLNNFAWDTMLGEHALEEDKKGQYGLKPLTKVFFPEFAEYADELHAMLAAIEGESQLDNIRSERKKAGDDDAAKLSAPREDDEARVTKTLKRVKAAAVKKKKGLDGGFEHIPLETLLLYAAVDTDMTRRLAMLQMRRMRHEEDAYREARRAKLNDRFRRFPIPMLCQKPQPVKSIVTDIAVPASRVLSDMEYQGIKVDRAYAEYLDEKLADVITATEAELRAMSPQVDVKLNAAAAIANILFNEGFAHPETGQRVTYPVVSVTKRNQAQTTEKVLKHLVARYSCPFSAKLLIYRKATKAKNTFIANVRDLSEQDGFLHTNYNVHGTGTGRLSSHDENLQNIPKKLANFSIKKLFIPDDPSMVFVNADAKGAEVRIFSAYSQDAELIRSLNDGLDTHSFFADAIVTRVRMEAGADEVLESMGLDNSFPLTYDDFANRDAIKKTNGAYGEMLDKFRTAIKRVVFGILYGAGPKKIAETIGISLSQAQAIIDMLFQLYPSIPAYIDRTKWELNTFGLVETYFGRRRRFAVKGATGYLRSRAERQAVNFKIQSTSSDIVMNCLVGIAEPLQRDMRGRLLLTVHDSLGFQIPRRYVSQLPDFIDQHLNIKPATKYPWLPVEFKWDYEVGANYGEVKSLSAYLEGLTPEERRNDAQEAYTEEEVRTELADAESD